MSPFSLRKISVMFHPRKTQMGSYSPHKRIGGLHFTPSVTYTDHGDDGPFTQGRVVRQLELSGHDPEDAVGGQPLPEQVSPRILDQGGG